MSCLICDRIALIKQRKNRYFVAELETGYVVLGDHQFFRGYTLFLSKKHVPELHDLPRAEKERFLIEMSLVAEAVYHAFKPKKLNYECLGNSEPHLHWHLTPRHIDDPSPTTPTWEVDKNLRYDDQYLPSDEDLEQMKALLLDELSQREGLRVKI